MTEEQFYLRQLQRLLRDTWYGSLEFCEYQPDVKKENLKK